MSAMITAETTRYESIKGFPGYRIGSDGSVWSAWAYNGHQARGWTTHRTVLECSVV